MSTSLKISTALFGIVLVSGLACRKPEPVKPPAPAVVDPAIEAAAKAKREAEARLKAESERRAAELAKAKAAEQAEAARQTSFRQEAEKALQDVHFEFDEASLGAAGKDTLQGIASFLGHYPKVRIQVEGHCDERGTGEYNLALGERRAHAALDYLKGLGVPEAQLSAISYGKEKPVCQDSSEACWSRNRRAHFTLKS